MRKTLCFAVVLTVLLLHSVIGLVQDGPDSERTGNLRKSSSNLRKNSQSSGSLTRGQSGLNSAGNKSRRRDFHNARAVHPRASALKADGAEQALAKKILQASSSLNESKRWATFSFNGRSGAFPLPFPKKRSSPDGKILAQLYTSGWMKLHDIHINYGEIVFCHTQERGRFTRKTHFFLAVNDHQLQHVYPVPGDTDKRGVIVVEDKANICHKFWKFLDCDSCKNLGNRGYRIAATTQRAEKWVNRYTFYNEDSCSSYHWVVYWMTDRVPEPRVHIPFLTHRLSRRCRLKTIKTNPEPLETDMKIPNKTLAELDKTLDEEYLAEAFKDQSNQSDTESVNSDGDIAIIKL